MLEFCKLKLLLRMHMYRKSQDHGNARNWSNPPPRTFKFTVISLFQYIPWHSHSFEQTKKLQLCLLNLTAFKEAVAKYTIRVKSDLLQMGLNKELHPHMYKASSSVWTKTKTLHCHSANIKVYRKLSKAKFKSKIFWYKSFKLAFFSRQKKYLMKIAPAYTFL